MVTGRMKMVSSTCCPDASQAPQRPDTPMSAAARPAMSRKRRNSRPPPSARQEEIEADIAEISDVEALRRRGLQQPGQRLVAAAEEAAGHAEENYLIVERHPGPEGRAQSPDQRGRRPGKSQVDHDALEDFFFSTSAVTPAPTARPTMSAVTVMPRPEPSMVPLIIKSLRVLFAASMAEVAPLV